MSIAMHTLAYARRLREAGISEEQAEAHAEALAAAMTDTLATKQDLGALHVRFSEIDAHFARIDTRFAQIDTRFAQIDARFTQIDAPFEYLEKHLDVRLLELEKRIEIRFGEQSARFDGRLTEMEHRITTRLGAMMVAGFGVVSVLVKLL